MNVTKQVPGSSWSVPLSARPAAHTVSLAAYGFCNFEPLQWHAVAEGSANKLTKGEIADPFTAVRHELAGNQLLPTLREEDESAVTLVRLMDAGTHFAGKHGRLLAFKRKR